jgi:hypothetical protein
MSSSVLYPWERRWLQLTSSANQFEPPYQFDSSGYVVSHRAGPDFRTYELIGVRLSDLTAEHVCVVLLGEPGMGKSQEWAEQQALLTASPHHIFLDLGTESSEDRLERKIQANPKVLACQAENAVLTLWLDSLDEGLLHINTLQTTLLDILRSLTRVQLRLRIMCRNAVWQPSFADALGKLLAPAGGKPSDAVTVLLLNPLSQQQVRQAAEQEGFDVTQFLLAVAASDAQPLAGRPVTLGLLIQLYKRHQPHFGATGPTTRSELYEQGCLLLCERPDHKRPSKHRHNARHRLLLAGYLAMVMVLTNRRLVHTELVVGGLPSNELDPYALGGGSTAAWQGEQASIDRASLLDLFSNTGLFTDLGGGRMMWAHQSYAEFLAAWYLNLTGMSTASLRPLFRSAVDSQGGIVPALLETAAWLADLQPAFWNEILVIDPVALLQSDLRRLTDTERSLVVERLIRWFAGLAHVPYQGTSFMQYLCHSGLASQLEPLLSAPAAPNATAHFAVDLALACKTRELLPLLVGQALQTTLPYPVRRRALYILRGIADDASREKLRRLLVSLPEEDEDGQFHNELLHILWPTHLTVDELLPMLVDRKKKRTLGNEFSSYFVDFADGGFTPAPAALLASLRWLNARIGHLDKTGELEELWGKAGGPFWKEVWKVMDDDSIAQAYTDLFVAAVRKYKQPSAAGTQAQRLDIFKRLLARRDRPDAWRALYHLEQGESLIKDEDWEELEPLLYSRLAAPSRAWLTEVLARLLTHNMTESKVPAEFTTRFAKLYDAARKYRSVRETFRTWYRPDKVKSKSRLKNRKHQLKSRERERKEVRNEQNRRRATLRYSRRRRRRIAELLDGAATGTLHHWGVLLYYVGTAIVKLGTSEPHDITQSQGWAKRLTVKQQTALVNWACALVERYANLPTEWCSLDNVQYYDARRLHRAYLVCLSQRPTFLQEQPAAFWQQWADFLLKFGNHAPEGEKFESLKLAVAVAPGVIVEAILRLVNANNANGHSVWYDFQEIFRALPESDFPLFLLQAIQDGKWQDDFSGKLLVDMLEVHYQPAWGYVDSLIPKEPLAGKAGPALRPELIVATYRWLLFDRKSSVDWWHWFKRLTAQPPLAMQVLTESISHLSPRELQQLAKLTEAQLDWLMRWLTNSFSLTSADVNDWQENTPNGRIASLRSAAGTELATRGTLEAWSILQDFSDSLGNPFWMQLRVDQVRENLRRNAWEPLPPDVLIQLSQPADRRWVRSADDLMELIIESLGRFQTDLQGALNSAEQLWMPTKSAKNATTGQRIHDENYLSNVIRRHLTQDIKRSGILIKREVEIRPSAGKGTGQRVDIYVDAYTLGADGVRSDEVTVVIEVKLSKNKEVETAINEQLIGYLANQTYKHGIFLVGWHYGQYYKKPKKDKDFADLQQLLDQQAAAATGYTIWTKVLDIRLPSDTGRTH